MIIKVALIGLGKMGLSHLAIVNALDNFSVQAIIDKQKLNKIFLGNKFNIKNEISYLNLNELDAVIISTPNFTHYDLVRHFLSNDIHVFVEKPLTIDPNDSSELNKLSSIKNLANQVGYVNRFNPTFRKAKSLIDSGAIGNIVSYKNTMYGNVVSSGNSNSWRNHVSSGGGCLFDYGSHCIDLCIFFFENVDTVNNCKLGSIHSLDADDFVECTFNHKSGVQGKLEVNWCKQEYRKAFNEIHIHATHGEMVVNKQQIKLESTISKPELNLKAGVNEFFATDNCQNTKFYLRGEDFSEQIINFGQMISGNDSYIHAADFSSSCHVDEIINNIRRNA